MNRRTLTIIIAIAFFSAILIIAEIIFPSEKSYKPNKVPEKTTVTAKAPSNDTLKFVLTAGEQGNYGKYITYNRNTEFQDSFYAYFVPYGTYSVTNIGEYPTQINVYSDERIYTEEGWEEPKYAHCKLLDIGQVITIYVYNGHHIEIDEPSKLELKFESDDLPETTKVTTPAPIETTEAVTEVPACEGTVGDYFISLNGASICYSDEGNPILIVTYGFTNNSDEAESMSYADIIVTVYQKGIELDTAWPSDIPDDVSYDYSNYSRKVQPGTTIEAQNAYELFDVSSQVIIEIEELFNFSNDSNKLVFHVNF